MGWIARKFGKAAESDFDREIAFHVEEATRANMGQGMPETEARRQALIRLGGREQATQQMREVHALAWWESFRFHLRSATRFVRRSPSFAVTVIATLALGIGANSAVFSAVDAILLRPLPFPHSDQLVRIRQHDSKLKVPESYVSTQRLEDLNRLSSTFQAISGYYTGDATLTSGPLPEKASVAFVAPRFLKVWGVQPALGRDFLAEEQLLGGPNAALVTNRFWRGHLAADPHAVGKVLRMGKASYTVVGVLPASFLFPEPEIDLFEPNPVNAPYAQDRTSTWFIVTGRMKPGTTIAQASADLARVQSDLGRQYPASDLSLSSSVQPLKSVVTDGVQGSLWLLYGSVSLLLLIACTNIAALLMARTTVREHEVGIRFALGASRSSIIAQLLVEVFALVMAGAVVGLLIASGTSSLLGAFAKDLPRLAEVALNWRLVAYTLVSTVAVTLLCGLLPAMRGTRRTLAGSISHFGRTQVSARSPWQWTFVGVQVALAVALLIGSGLLLRSFAALGRVDPGFESAHVLTLHVSGTWFETGDMGKLTQRVNRTLDALRSVPGVEAAATSATIPGNAIGYPGELSIVDGPKSNNAKLSADTHFVSSGYFAAMHIPVLLGKGCEAGLPFETMVVNRSFANAYLGGASAIGHHLLPLPVNAFLKAAEIRGIVGDAREQGLNTPAQPTVYWCVPAPNPDPNYLIRVQGDPMAMAETVRRKIRDLEPSRAVSGLMPLDAHLDNRLAENRLRTVLLTGFAMTAIALVSIGLYGTVSYLGRTRRREVGLRLALGAMPRQIARGFVWQGLRVTLLGGCIGLVLGAAVTRLFANMLYGISALDPVTYEGVVLLTFAVTLAAIVVPAVRAAAIDPNRTLREE